MTYHGTCEFGSKLVEGSLFAKANLSMDEITKASSESVGVLSSSNDKSRFRNYPPRWILLPIIGSVIGAIVGCIYVSQLPNQYKATAQIQVVSSSEEIATAIRSSAVLKNAVERIDLSQHRSMKGTSAEEIIGLMREGQMLELKLVGEDVNSRMVNISVTTTDQMLSGELVKAIVDGYEVHASQKSQSSIVRLEIPTIGGFSGPYWPTYVVIGALLGLVAFSVITISRIPELLGRLLKGRTRLAGSSISDSKLFSSRAILKKAPQS